MAEGQWLENYDFGNGNDLSGVTEQPSGWDPNATWGAINNSQWQQPADSGGGMWGGFGKLGLDLLGSSLPSLLGGAAGYGFNALFPGKTQLIDQRNPEQRGAAGMNFSRMSALQQNPNSFGLPGDPEDPNSPAGRKKYGIVQSSRSADAARGAFTTGGAAQRETNALNDAVGREYNTIWNQSSQNAMAGPGMTMQQKENPWAKILGGVVSPAISGITGSILRNFGLNVPQQRDPGMRF